MYKNINNEPDAIIKDHKFTLSIQVISAKTISDNDSSAKIDFLLGFFYLGQLALLYQVIIAVFEMILIINQDCCFHLIMIDVWGKIIRASPFYPPFY